MFFPFGVMSVDAGTKLTTSDVDETQVRPRENMFAATHCPFAFSDIPFAPSHRCIGPLAQWPISSGIRFLGRIPETREGSGASGDTGVALVEAHEVP
jgi:hypothetical protein